MNVAVISTHNRTERRADLARRLAAEGIGTALLLAIIVGSGIMGDRLADGNAAIALLANSAATGAGLFVLIKVFGPISGAHFNPAVTMVEALVRKNSIVSSLGYLAAQCCGGLLGVWTAHLMFGERLFQIADRVRGSAGEILSEGVAAFGLLFVILAGGRVAPRSNAALVGLYIASAYWFTASTSFANPAVTIARVFTDTFSGIAPVSAPAFIAAQIVGALIAAGLFRWFFRSSP